jgi:hypothetical protein
MKIALLSGLAVSSETEAVEIEIEWSALVGSLREPTFTACAPCPGKSCPQKAGRAWLPARLITSPCKRLDANIAAVTLAVFDLDDPTPEQMGRLAQALDGYRYVCHQTHRGAGYRLILPLAAEVPAPQWRSVWKAIATWFEIPADPACINESRLYYSPTRPAGSEYQIFTGEGMDLDWTILEAPQVSAETYSKAIAATSAAKTDPADAANLREGPLDLAELRRAVSAMRRPESRELLDTVLSGRALAPVGQRDTVIQKAVSLLATAVLGKPYPAEAILALLHGSIRAMDCEPEGLDHWLEIARLKYLRAVGRRLERDAASDADRVALMKVLGQTPAALPAGEDWRKGLLYIVGRDGAPTGLRAIGANANLIMHRDPKWHGTLRFNEVTREIDVSGGPLAGKPKATLDTEAANWLARSEYGLFLASRDVGEQMLALARERAYDPLREWLEGLTWDGTDRVVNFFRDYFGAEGDEAHLMAIAQAFLISCVARAMKPGCEVHTVPILIGPQGAGKSRGLKALGQPFFTDSGLVIGDKDSRMLIASRWIVELAELASVRNADIEKVKSFVSLARDDFRPPYGRVTESFERRCVFVGSTNDDEVLSDWTGNRRWWPMRIRSGFTIDVDKITRDRDQIFAQALVMYRAGQRWHLTDEEACRAEREALGFRKVSVRAEQILAWFAGRAPNDRPREMTTFDLLSLVLGVPSGSITAQQSVEVGHAARELGFTKHRRVQGGKAIWIYRVPESICLMAREEKPKSVSLVAVSEVFKS